jgi:hypothetical protein
VIVRLARLVILVVLAALASGAPTVVRAALDAECCERGCDDPDEHEPCPPDCNGPCVKVAAPPAAMAATNIERQLAPRAAASTGVAAPVLPLVATGVFHPPRT